MLLRIESCLFAFAPEPAFRFITRFAMSLGQYLPTRALCRRLPLSRRPSLVLRLGCFGFQAALFPSMLFSLLVGAMAAQGQAPAPAGQTPKKIVYPATIVVSCDLPCKWSLDGKPHGAIDEGKTAGAGVQLGEHQVVAETLDGLDQTQQQLDQTGQPSEPADGKYLPEPGFAAETKVDRREQNAGQQGRIPPQPTPRPEHEHHHRNRR